MKKLHILSVLFLGSLLASCEKVINIDLNKTEPQIVIEGNVTNEQDSSFVRITKTVNFDQDNVYPAVSGAIVTIADDLGHTDTFTETVPGVYKKSGFTGVVGHTYSMKVIAEGKTFTSMSTMAAQVSFDTLSYKVESFGGFGGGSSDSNYTIYIRFKDPEGISNYYLASMFINGKKTPDVFVTDDRFLDGNEVFTNLFTQEEIKKGNEVRVAVWNIDKTVFNYFNSIPQQGGGPFGSATPANPTTNIVGAKLGYFSAHTVQSKTVTIQ